MNVEIIFAQDLAGGIGLNGRLPWPHFKPDMKRFQELTTGEDKIVVMGRKTHADILAAAKERGRTNKDIKKKGLLKGRTSVVLSSTQDEFHGAVGMKTLRDVFNEYQLTDKTIVVIGGEKLFVEALSWANTAHVSVFDKHYNCDRHLPTTLFNETDWAITPTEKIAVDGEDCHAYFITFARRNPVNVVNNSWVRFNANPY